MRPKIHPKASAEYEHTAEYYEVCEPGLGVEFAEQLERDLATLLETPAVWPSWPGVPVELRIQRFRLRRFPYAIAYRIEGDVLHIYAIAAYRRRPGYWLSRVGR